MSTGREPRSVVGSGPYWGRAIFRGGLNPGQTLLGLTDHTRFYQASTSELYGLVHNPERFEQEWLKPKTDIPGLYLTGQDILTCGVVGAMIGGLVSTLAIQGWRGAGLAKRIFVG